MTDVAHRPMTERELQDAVVDLAHLYRWRVIHHGGDQHRKAHYDTTGFPDLTLIHEEHPMIWFRELKSAAGKLTPMQHVWIERLKLGGHNVDVWRPDDLPDIAAALSTGRARVA